MNNTLDTYLQALAHELRKLPAEQRESELREMRQHLEAMVARLVEDGLTKAEAMKAATTQFGVARTVGRQLKQSGSLQEAWWRIVLAPVGGASTFMLGQLVLDPLTEALKPWVSMSSPLFPAVLFFVSWLLCVAAGAVAAWISPRWGQRLLLGLLGVSLLASVLLAGMITGVDCVALLVGSAGILVGSRVAKRQSSRPLHAQRP